MFRFSILFLALVAFNVFSQDDRPLETILQKGHSKYITAADWHPSGEYVVTAGFDNSIILWNVLTGKQIRLYNRHTDAVWSVQFSPDGKQILSSSADQTIKLYDVLTGDLVHTWKAPKDEVRQAYFSRNGQHIILVGNRDAYFLFDRITGEPTGELKKDFSAFYQSDIIDLSGTRALNRGGYKEAFISDIESGDTLVSVEFDKVHQMAFSPDGSMFALSSTKLFAKVFDAESGKELANLEDPDSEERCDGCNTKIAWSNDSKYIITASNRVDAIIWEARSGKKLRTFKDVSESQYRPTMIRFSNDNSHVVFNVNGVLYGYDTKTARKTIEVKSDHLDYYDVNISPDGNYVIIPGKNNMGEIWNIKTGKKKTSLKGYLNHDRDDGMRYSYESYWDSGILEYISMRRAFALSPDNRHIVIGSIDSTAIMIELASGKVVQEFKGHGQVVIAFDFSPDGKMLATGGGDRHLLLWDVETGDLIEDLGYHRDVIFDLSFSHSGEKIVTTSWDGSFAVWNLKDRSFEFKDLNNMSAYRIGFTPNDLYIVAGNLKNNFNFYEADALESFRDLTGNKDVVGDYSFSPDAKSIVTASWDGKVKVWDVLSGMLIGRNSHHEGQVYAVDWDPKNRFIASGAADNNIILWDPTANKVVATLSGHTNAVTCLTFTSDGKKLISQSAEGVIKVWDMMTLNEDYSRIQISRNEWLSTTSSGHFDGSSKALNLVNYVSGMEVVPVGSLFDKYYSPGLIKRINEGEDFNDQGENIQKLIETSPTIAFHLTESSKRSIEIEVDSVYSWKKEVLPLGIQINSYDQDVDEIRIYNNGKLIIAESLEENIVFRGGDKDMRNYDVKLTDGTNKITGYVINSDRTESAPVHVEVEFDGEAAQTDLYILTIGINKYKNPKYDLDYAVNDSKAFMKAVTDGGDTLFYNIFEYTITNEKATKEVIEATIEEIKKKIGPEDVFLFYYAGHGVMSLPEEGEDSDFYIVTHDVTNLYGGIDMLNEKAISATELMQYSMEISAEKQLFVLDACHSGGALESFATRGDGREKALAQLARSTGTFFLTAAQDAQYANEVGNLKHGLFTYALLEIINGEKGDNGDGKVTINEVKSYVEDRVPELSEEHRGSPQYPTSYSFGQDFPLVILK